jgi:hypothetical protein
MRAAKGDTSAVTGSLKLAKLPASCAAFMTTEPNTHLTLLGFGVRSGCIRKPGFKANSSCESQDPSFETVWEVIAG